VLELPELKIVKPSDTSWLAHEKCVLKKCYIAIVAALEQAYEDSHEPEVIGNKILMKPTTCHLPFRFCSATGISKLNKCLQTEFICHLKSC